MSDATIVSGFLSLGLIRTYKNGKIHQPVGNIYAGLEFPPAGLTLNTKNMLSTAEPPHTSYPTEELNVYDTSPNLITHWGIYVLSAAVGYGHLAYWNNAEYVELPAGQIPDSHPTIRIENGASISVYVWVWFFQYVSESFLFKKFEKYFIPHEKPYYKHLIIGYPYDTKSFPSFTPKIIPEITEQVTIGFYRNNHLEPIPALTSIDWVIQTISLTKGVPHYLYLKGIVLGTLYVVSGSSRILDLLGALSTENEEHSYNTFLPQGIADLFSHWNSIANEINIVLPDNFTQESAIVDTETSRKLNKLSANNNHWKNDDEERGDINPGKFELNSERAYQWHIKQQRDGSRGDLVMNSPTIVNIGLALEAEKYAVNELDNTKPRIATLGHYINRQSELLGYRIDANGEVNEKLEKEANRRMHVDGSESVDPQKYNPNCFASEGMIVRHLPNKFEPNGEKMKTKSGGYRKIRDIPQFLSEMHEQANAAMGYQEGTAIEINLDGEIYRYPNQLALMTEIFITLKQTATYSKGSFFSSLVSEQSIKEVMGGLGLRTVDKYLEFEVAKKTVKLYYKGISASQSIRRKLSAVATNVGMVFGNII